MATFGMCEMVPIEVAGFDARTCSKLLCQQTSAHDSVHKLGHVSSSRRVLQVLVVDNEQDSTDQFVRLVRRWGHAARGVYRGLTSLRVAAAQHPDIVLLNLELPHMDGLQVARHLRLDFPRKECLIIAIAARADDERRRQSIEAGIDLLFIKPVDPSVVETLLMLESVRVSRSWKTNAAGLDGTGSSPFSCRKPSANKTSAMTHQDWTKIKIEQTVVD
jgi:CheY-like chemotaxis protein